MGFFLKRKSAPTLPVTQSDLARLGSTGFGGESPFPPGLAPIMTELDQIALRCIELYGAHSMLGTPDWDRACTSLIGELDQLVDDDPWAGIGALCASENLVTNRELPAYVSLLEMGLTFLRTDGVALAALPQSWVTHYTKKNTFTSWPGSMDYLPPEQVGDPGVNLAIPNVGDSVVLARTHFSGFERELCAERRETDRIVAVLEGATPERTSQRWDWTLADGPVQGSNDYTFCMAFGDAVGFPPTIWCDPRIASFFPRRPRTRQQMREIARAQPADGGI